MVGFDPGFDAGQPGLSGPCNPGAALGHPEPVGLSHANPGRLVSHLTRPTRVNPPDPGQPGINNPVRPIFSRLLSATDALESLYATEP